MSKDTRSSGKCLPGFPLLHFVQFRNFVQQLARLPGIRNPRGRASEPSLEIIRSRAQKLIANMQCLAALNPSEDPLAGQNAPGLVSNVHKNIVAAIERTEGQPLSYL